MQNQNKLRSVRTSEGLTITELAHFASVNEKTIRDIEKGRRDGSEVIRHRIIRGLNENPKKSQTWTYEELFESAGG